MNDLCPHCGEAFDHHDWEFIADVCQPKQIEALEKQLTIFREGLQKILELAVAEQDSEFVTALDEPAVCPFHLEEMVRKIIKEDNNG